MHEISSHVKRSFAFQVKCSCGWVSKEYMMERDAIEEAKNHLYQRELMGEKVEKING